jgi:hypothetical protein
MSDKYHTAQKTTEVDTGGEVRPDFLFPVVNLINVYPDSSYSGPSFIYKPTGESQYYRFELFQATSDTTGKTPTMYQFYGGAPKQLVYLPYVHSTTPTSGTVVAQPPNSPVNLETHGLTDCSALPKLTALNVYKTFSVTLNGAITTCRHVSLLGTFGTAPAQYIPSTCVAESKSSTGNPTGFRLHHPSGVQVCYLWRQITTTCSNSQCPEGYAAGSVDFYLQFGAS